MSATSIGWTDLTLNPVIGCTHAGYQGDDGVKRAHPGCTNCYAEGMCSRKLPGFTGHNACSKGGKWTGEIEVIHERLAWPFTRKEYQPRRDGKQRRCFLTSLSDMGHPGLAEQDWMAVQGMMLLAPGIIWQDLTKRPERQRMLLEKYSPQECAEAFIAWFREYMGDVLIWRYAAERCSRITDSAQWSDFSHIHRYVSVSDQATADSLIPELLRMPCAVRGVSLEPMIGPVDFGALIADDGFPFNPLEPAFKNGVGWVKRIHHVIVGGESGRGNGIRPFALEWALDIVQQCERVGTACFVKQMGSKPYAENVNLWDWPNYDGDFCEGGWEPEGLAASACLRYSGKGDNPLEWPEALRVQQNVGDV